MEQADWHLLAEADFARGIAEALEKQAEAGDLGKRIIVASPERWPSREVHSPKGSGAAS